MFKIIKLLFLLLLFEADIICEYCKTSSVKQNKTFNYINIIVIIILIKLKFHQINAIAVLKGNLDGSPVVGTIKFEQSVIFFN